MLTLTLGGILHTQRTVERVRARACSLRRLARIRFRSSSICKGPHAADEFCWHVPPGTTCAWGGRRAIEETVTALQTSCRDGAKIPHTELGDFVVRLDERVLETVCHIRLAAETLHCANVVDRFDCNRVGAAVRSGVAPLKVGEDLQTHVAGRHHQRHGPDENDGDAPGHGKADDEADDETCKD